MTMIAGCSSTEPASATTSILTILPRGRPQRPSTTNSRRTRRRGVDTGAGGDVDVSGPPLCARDGLHCARRSPSLGVADIACAEDAVSGGWVPCRGEDASTFPVAQGRRSNTELVCEFADGSGFYRHALTERTPPTHARRRCRYGDVRCLRSPSRELWRLAGFEGLRRRGEIPDVDQGVECLHRVEVDNKRLGAHRRGCGKPF